MKKLIIALSLITIIGASKSHCSDFQSQVVIDGIKQNHTSKFELKSFTNFEWDRVYIFGPYTPISEISKAINTKVDDNIATTLKNSDNFNVLIFLLNGKVKNVVSVPRSYGDFSEKTLSIPYTPESAIFIKKKRSDNWIVIEQDI